MNFAREDWTLFRSLNTLSQKAGVPANRLGPLVVKELVDNALDAGANVTVTEEGGWILIDDDGPGIPHALIPTLFSINRPLTSSKIVRLPTRGALGNGLRVVMGAIYASHGGIIIETGGQDEDAKRFVLNPRDDGHTDIVETSGTSKKLGTRISLQFGPTIHNDNLLSFADISLVFAKLGTHYKGKTSPWWYDSESFFEMCQAAGPRPLADILTLFRDIKRSEAEAIAPPSALANMLSRANADTFLSGLRTMSKEPKPVVLGKIDEVQSWERAAESGIQELPSGGGEITARIPYVIEVFARESEDEDSLMFMVNRTLITGKMDTYRTKPTELVISGAGLRHRFKICREKVNLCINITLPYMPITTDGKEPDLRIFLEPLHKAITKASGKLKRIKASSHTGIKNTQKEVIETVLFDAIAKASGNGQYRYSLRQLYYAVRPYVMARFDKLDYNYFGTVITQIEGERGQDLPGMYRDPRGVIYHPHTHEDIPLGTINVEKYQRPAWTFNKILYIEKGGFFSLLKDEGWPDRNDCALMTSQGFASRAARDVIDLIGDTQEEIYFFCIHDADASGTMIYQSLLEATAARGARKVHIINLGLEPSEGRAMGLEVEQFREFEKNRLPVADYVPSADRRWLQTQRIELNAMTSPEFMEWLDGKFAEYEGKIVPPQTVIHNEFIEQSGHAIAKHLTAKILDENYFDGRMARLFNSVDPDDAMLETIIREKLVEEPAQRWDTPLSEHAEAASKELVYDRDDPTWTPDSTEVEEIGEDDSTIVEE